jgi:dCTP deaminase
MLLSDQDLHKAIQTEELGISPFMLRMIQPASIDLELGEVGRGPDEQTWNGWGIWDIKPGEFVLACTRQVVTFPNHLAGRVEGKSTWGRRGLMIHAAGFVDPGFTGQLTLEFKNLGEVPIRVTERDFICQLAVWKMATYALYPYGSHARMQSHYQGQMGVTPAWK